MEGDAVPVRQTRMVYTVNRAIANVLAGLTPRQRIDSLNLEFSRGWDESTDRQKGYFKLQWGAPGSWDDVILQGPHLYVATPMYKSVNPTMKNKPDWSSTDFEALSTDAVPVTAYKPIGNRHSYNTDYDHWNSTPLGLIIGLLGGAWRRTWENER